MYTAQVTETRAWLSDPYDTSSSIVCGTVETTPLSVQQSGDLRYFAGNIVEGVLYAQTQTSRTLVLRHLSSRQKDQVALWVGKLLLLRTVDGERMFVFYQGITQTKMLRTTPEDGTAEDFTFDVEVQFYRVSFDETQI